MPLDSIAQLELQLKETTQLSMEYVDLLHQLVFHYLNSDLDKAKSLIEEALHIANEIDYKDGIGMSLHQKGVTFYNIGDFENALNYYMEADKTLADSKDWKKSIKPKANIGMVYIHTSQYEEALRIYKEIELELEQVPLDIIHAQMYINIDVAYCLLKDPENGIIYSKKALEIAHQLNNLYGVAISHTNLAGHLILLNKPEEAIIHLTKSEKICLKENYKIIQTGNYLKFADCYTRLKDTDKALEYIALGISSAQETMDMEKEALLLKQKMIIYEIQQLFELAYNTSKSYLEKKEAFLNAERIKSFNTLQLRYETEKKEVALNQLKLEQVQSELTALKSQMNPHFIFNVLNSIQELYTLGDKHQANIQMGNFARLTRKILEVSGKQVIDMDEEIEILTTYLNLESMRFETDFSYTIEIPENAEELYIPPMLIQPFIENSIKHGLLHKKGEKKLEISFEINANDDILICRIADNGIGRKASEEINKQRHKLHQSFAASATEKRLQLLNMGKTKNIAVSYEDLTDSLGTAAGTSVTLCIPYS